jgi:hypothetical protein
MIVDEKHEPDVVGLQEESVAQVASITNALPGYSYVKPHVSKGGGLLIRTEAWHSALSMVVMIRVERFAG